MYTKKDYITKKELIADFKNGIPIRIYNPGPFGDAPRNGEVFLEGPHYPRPHKWYVRAIMKDGKVIKIF